MTRDLAIKLLSLHILIMPLMAIAACLMVVCVLGFFKEPVSICGGPVYSYDLYHQMHVLVDEDKKLSYKVKDSPYYYPITTAEIATIHRRNPEIKITFFEHPDLIYDCEYLESLKRLFLQKVVLHPEPMTGSDSVFLKII